MRVLDLFSGIGGFSLGLERAGMTTVAFCEIDKKAQKVLRKHWPDVPIFEDVSTLTKEMLDERGITADVICGGFPCQDISYAGAGAGIEGERSGLWSEYARLIGELRPRYAIVENVSALLSRGLDRVLGDLASLGYDAEWNCIPAAAVGAPHRRDRIWIVAYPSILQQHGGIVNPETCIPQISKSRNCGCSDVVAHPNSQHGRPKQPVEIGSRREARDQSSRRGSDGSDTDSQGLEGQWQITGRIKKELNNTSYSCWWAVEPDLGRVAYGVPNRVDRLKQLGNAVVPQIPELIGRAIMGR